MTSLSKILFLDIDGVINSRRTSAAFGGYPGKFSQKDLLKFDWVAIGLIRTLCEVTDASICLSSTWRHEYSAKAVANALDLRVIDVTPALCSNPEHANRGAEIQQWLSEHPDVTTYAIVDDVDEFLPEKKPYFVQTDDEFGLTLNDFNRLRTILGVLPRAE